MRGRTRNFGWGGWRGVRQAVVVGKPATAELPVFFGKSEACRVDASAFAVMSETNPREGKTLQVIAPSEPWVEGLQALGQAGWEGSGRMKQHLVEVSRNLHLEPSSRPLLILFETVRTGPFEGARLDAVRRLRTVHEQFRKEARPQ